jgi:DNA-binding MarR family transcriptional regulator
MSKGLSKNQQEILKWFDEHPNQVGTVKPLQQITDTSWPSLRRALYSLERRGLIKRIGIGARHFQRWVKTEKERG